MARMFISYPHLDGWIEKQKVIITGDQMTMDDGKNYRLAAAVYFRSVVGGEADPNNLIGKVKTEVQLAALNAEHYKDSVLVGDVGYQVLEGFVSEPA
jgi:hypothetical protein